jgi:spore germination cell wall hydrolase CwlJ-like protein
MQSLKGLAIALAVLVTLAIMPRMISYVDWGIEYKVSIPKPTPFLVATSETFNNTEKERNCLAKNIYYEARGEGEKGMYAVAQVTINRLKTGMWGNTVCRVVYAPSQFSWTLDDNLRKPRGDMWIESLRIANRVLNGEQVFPLMTALFYHADYVSPRWRDDEAKIKQIGAHIFYASALGNRVRISVDNI